jgi:hypothetical protein
MHTCRSRVIVMDSLHVLPSSIGDSGLGDIMVRAQLSYMCFLALIPVWYVCWLNHLAAYNNFVVSHCFMAGFGFLLSSICACGLVFLGSWP